MYKVTCLYNGTTYVLHDPESDDLRIYNDEVVTEDNAPGSFTITINYDHPYLQYVCGQQSDIRVYDGEDEIFRGRPIDDGEDLYRERTFKCEGELAFLYDSIQPRRELHNITPLQFFTLLVEEHNNQVENQGMIDKTFTVGVVTVTDSNNSLYRYTNFETTYDAIMDKIIDRLGGHLQVRIENGVRYLDLLADVSTVSDQPIQLGENLLAYARDTDYTQIATACIPLGVHLEETEIAALDAYLDIKSVNNNSNMLKIAQAVSRYGFICKVIHFDDITVPANLKTAGENWLQEGQYATMSLDLTAVDLHTLGVDVQPIRINTQVHVISEPHGMDRYFEVSKRTYHLTAPDTDTVSFGATDRVRSYTSSSHSNSAKVSQKFEEVHTQIAEAIAGERANISNILNMATHGYVVLDPNDGPERILIMDTNSVDTAQKIWKWDMNGLGYSSTGIDGPWSTAITMNGEISADFIVTGSLLASLITSGKIQSQNGKVYFDLDNDELVCTSMKSGATEASGNLTLEMEVGQFGTGYYSYLELFNNKYPSVPLCIKPSESGYPTYFSCEEGLIFHSGGVAKYGPGTTYTGGQIQVKDDTVWILCGRTSGSNYGSISVSRSGVQIEPGISTRDFSMTGTFTYKGREWNPFSTSSDRRLKKDIDGVESDFLEAVGQVEIVQFRWKDMDDTKYAIGIIAQDLVKRFEDAGVESSEYGVVVDENDDLGNGYYSVKYTEFILARIAYDEQKIAEQQAEIDDLRARVERLEKILEERMGV